VDAKSPPKDRHVEIACREAWEESLRLLYVALTRARHRCTVHWGAMNGFGNSPLGRVLHGWDLVDAENPRIDDADLRARLDEIAAASGGSIGVRTAERPAGAVTYVPPTHVDDELTVRRLDRRLDRRWQRTSFSRLTRRDHVDEHGVDDEGAARDVDAGTAPDLRDAAGEHAADGGPDVPLARFPRGAAAGTFLHDVLEKFDFTRADEDLAGVVTAQRARRALDVDPDVPVVDGLRAVLETPLGPATGGARLSGIGRHDRLVELDFDLPVAGGYRAGGRDLRLDELADVLARHTDELPILARYVPRLRALGARPARGFLTGSIDLVFRTPVDGRARYLIADHKSNWLGRRGLTPEDDRSPIGAYHPDRLATPMIGHHYLLQALIYLVGLHRLLRWRLGGTYDYDADVGGALYLFLRGMIGPDTPVTAAGEPHGVFALRPSSALVDELDALVAQREVVG
jgi:exodeoxyribonuclease V beta subunit